MLLLICASTNICAYTSKYFPNTKLITEVVKNEGFTVGWSNQHLLPLWVMYQLKQPWRFSLSQRPRFFNQDKRTQNSASSWDYSGGRYDRGHMAPNYAITRAYGKKAQRQTFLTSNAAPMSKKLNRKLWQRIEEAITRFILPKEQSLHIITGPILDKEPTKLNKKISIPRAFYKIIVDKNYRHALVFIVPQKVNGNEPLKQFISTINEVEKQTGIDFFLHLPWVQEQKLERYNKASYWNIHKFNTLAARY